MGGTGGEAETNWGKQAKKAREYPGYGENPCLRR